MPEIDQQDAYCTFEVEISDLEALPHGAPAVPGATGPVGRLLVHWQGPAYRRARSWLRRLTLLGLACTLLLILLSPTAGVTALLAAHWPFQQSRVLSLAAGDSSFSLAPGAIRCPSQATWSPDSLSLAVLGYTQPCAQDDYVPARLDLYAVSPMHRVASWQPDGAILGALLHPPGVSPRLGFWAVRKPISGMPQKYSAIPPIRYLQLLWSPDGRQLALSFGATTRVMTYEGILLADLDGGHARVLLYPEPWQIDPTHWAPLQWNLQSGTAIALNHSAPALTYAWSAHDTLVPLTGAHTSGGLSAYMALPPGNPAGDHTFSIWQPGHPAILSLMHMPGVYLWSSSFASWSPDGRFLITNFAVTGLMEPPGRAFPSSTALHTLGVRGVPPVPAHDRALLAAAAQARTVAWNPTGTQLAVYNLSGFVELYDCQTGRQLRLLKPTATRPLSGSAVQLIWSPDGRFLLLSSAQWAVVTLWGAGNFLSTAVSAK
jgi:WD40 repeat protein